MRKLSYELLTKIRGSKTGISFGDIKMIASSARCVCYQEFAVNSAGT